MSNPQDSAPSDRTGPVASMMQSVDALGSNTGRLFERLYGGLRRKSRSAEAERAENRLPLKAPIKKRRRDREK